MNIQSKLEGTKATITVTGKLLVATADELDKAVSDLADKTVDFDLDLSKLEYTSSAGLRVIVGTQKLAAKRGGTMRLIDPTDDVMEVLEMTGLSNMLTIVRS